MPKVDGGPEGLNKILEKAYATCMVKRNDKTRCSKIAWSAAKKVYKKEGGKWVKRSK